MGMERWRVYKDKTSVKLRSICKESEYFFRIGIGLRNLEKTHLPKSLREKINKNKDNPNKKKTK